MSSKRNIANTGEKTDNVEQPSPKAVKCSPEIISENGPGLSNNPDAPSVTFSSFYETEKCRDMFRQAFLNKESLNDDSEDSGAKFLVHPFPCGILPQFITEPTNKFIADLKQELLSKTFHAKDNDLYKFHQSDELKDCEEANISRLRDILYVDFISWLSDVTGITLYNKPNLMCSKYNYTDMLLCHDDELEGRRIAFIYYLVPPDWSAEDGGTLDLFSTHDNGEPSGVKRSIVPVENSLIFFEVSAVSFHQVSEVLREERCRMSVAGWFHGPPITRTNPSPRLGYELISPRMVEESLVYEWINPHYLDASIQKQVREKFQLDSEIELPNFLQSHVYDKLCSALTSMHQGKWKKKGPPNQRCVYVLAAADSEGVLRDCRALFTSKAMCVILSDLTALHLHPIRGGGEGDGETTAARDYDTNTSCKCHSEIRRWQHRCYTLLHDNDDGNSNDKPERAPHTECKAATGSDTALETAPTGSDAGCSGHGNGSDSQPLDDGTSETSDTSAGGGDFSLDSYYYLNADDWKEEYGGYVSYVVKDEEEELLKVSPSSNTLSLVYSDTMKFVKYINAKSRDKMYHDIHTIYYE